MSTKFSTLLIFILEFDYFKTSFSANKFRPSTSTKEMFHKIFFLDLSNRLHDSYHHNQVCFIAISVLKYKNYCKFYQMLLLLSDDISLNPVPTPNSGSQYFWKPFENTGLHFLHLNINSILPK